MQKRHCHSSAFCNYLVRKRVVAVKFARNYDIGVTRVALGHDFALLARIGNRLLLFRCFGAARYKQHASAQCKKSEEAKNTHFHIDPNPFKGFAFSVFIVTNHRNFVNSFLDFSKKRDIYIFSCSRIYLYYQKDKRSGMRVRCMKKREKKDPLSEIRQRAPALVTFFLLAAVTLAVTLQHLVGGEWHRAFVGTLTLLLLLVPTLVERVLVVHIPCTLRVIAYAFVFAAGMLGEIGGFYEHLFFWDDLLHALSGFMFAAFGFCLVGLAERGREKNAEYAPILVVLMAFCFSMSVGVFWELFEYAADAVLGLDMQKDTLLRSLHTVSLSNPGEGTVHLRGVAETVIRMENGAEVVLDGYLDVGLADTMADLFLNAVGAFVFCAIGFCYLRGTQGRFAKRFIPKVLEKNKG